MRPIIPLTLLALAAGCASDAGPDLRLTAVLDAETVGVRLHPGATTGVAGMMDQLCTFDAGSGEVLGEMNLGAGREDLLDAHGPHSLARHGGRLYKVQVGDTSGLSWGLDALDAGLGDRETLAVVPYEDSCAVAWLDDGGEHRAFAVPGTDCSGAVQLAVDPEQHVAWLSDGETLARVRPGGQVLLHEGVNADQLAFNAATGGVVLGRTGETWVQGLDAAGELAWERTLPHPLVSLDAAGGPGLVALVGEDERGGVLEILDPEAGGAVAVHPLPEPAQVSTSSDGERLALVTGDRAYLYEVHHGGTLVDGPTTSTVADRDAARAGGVIAGGGATVAGLAVLLILD
jgi:hypothetical protein